MDCGHTTKERDILFLKRNFSETPHKVRDRLCHIRRPLWRNIVPLHYLHVHVSDHLLLNVFLKGERAKSNNHPHTTLGKTMYCHHEGSARETATSMVLEDPNFLIKRVKGTVV